MAGFGPTALVRGLSFLAEKQASIANNLANVDTTAFKRRTALAQESAGFQSMLDRELTTIDYREVSDLSRGVIRETGRDYDVAIDGPQWLRVEDAQGNRFFSRCGQLQLGPDGHLSTRDGLKVLDASNQPISLGSGDDTPSQISISPNGTIGNPKTGQTFGTLALVTIPDPSQLVPQGKGLYQDTGNQPTTQASDGLQQGFLEGSNVDSLQELVQMITVERSFSATQRTLSGLNRLQENMITNMLR